MPKHIRRLILLLIVFLGAAVAARAFLVDPSYYQFGHYRGDAVPELATGQPQYKGPDQCRFCHSEQHGTWLENVHSTVKCEACHGPAGEHPRPGSTLAVPADSVRLCTLCHEAMPSRPAAHPQVDTARHPFPSDKPIQCITCHKPHAPQIGGSASKKSKTRG